MKATINFIKFDSILSLQNLVLTVLFKARLLRSQSIGIEFLWLRSEDLVGSFEKGLCQPDVA